MRCALAEYVVGKALADHIFVDVAVPHSPEIQQAISTTLDFLEARTPRREAVVRCQLLASYGDDGEDEEPGSSSVIIGLASKAVCAALDPLLPAGRIRDEFYSRVEDLLYEASSLWEPLRESRCRYTAEMRLDQQELVRNEDYYEDYGVQVAGKASASAPGTHAHEMTMAKAMLPLFPQISTWRNVVVPAKVLWSDQAGVLDARAEMETAMRHDELYSTDTPHLVKRRRFSAVRPTPAQGIIAVKNETPPRAASGRSGNKGEEDSHVSGN